MMKLRLAQPEYVIDIDPLADELGYVDAHDGEIRIGAMTRHRDLLESPLLERELAIFTDAERVIADPVVRNRGTIGGALCQADPSEDLSAVCAAVDARLVIRGTARGERVVDMHEFHQGPYETAVGPAEMLVEIRVPLTPRAGSAYVKVDRRVGDWAVVAAGAALELGRDGTIAGAGLALAAVGGDITCPTRSTRSSGRAARGSASQRGGAGSPRSACEPVTDQRGSEGLQAARRRRPHGARRSRRAARAAQQLMKEDVRCPPDGPSGSILGRRRHPGRRGDRHHDRRLAQRIAKQARTAVDGVDVVREQTDGLPGIARINDSGVRILHSARALRKVAVGK